MATDDIVVFPLTPHLYGPQHVELFAQFRSSDNDGGDGEWSQELDEHLRDDAALDYTEGLNTTYVFIDSQDKPVGYVALSCSSIRNRDDEGEALVDYLQDDRFPDVPVVLIGRIAVDRRWKRQRVGEAMLDFVKALALNLDIGARFIALHVAVRNKGARKFYKKHRFFVVPHRGGRLMLYDIKKSAAMEVSDDETAR